MNRIESILRDYELGNLAIVRGAIKDDLVTFPQLFHYYINEVSDNKFDLCLLVERFAQ